MEVIDDFRKLKFQAKGRILEITDYKRGWIHMDDGIMHINLSLEELDYIHNWVHGKKPKSSSKRGILKKGILVCTQRNVALKYEDLMVDWDSTAKAWEITDTLSSKPRPTFTDMDSLLDYLLITPKGEGIT